MAPPLPPPPDTVEAWYDHRVAAAVQPLLLGAGLFEVAVAIVVPAARVDPWSGVVAGLAAARAVLFLGAWARFRRHPPPDRLAHPIVAVVAALFLGNALLMGWLERSVLHTTSLMIVVIGAGAILLRWRWIAALAALAWAGWIALWATHPDPDGEAWLHFALALGGATALAAIVTVSRLRHERGLHDALLALHRSNRDLEAFARTASHDLRAPLQMIVAQAGMLGLDCDRSCSTVDFQRLERIVEEAQRMGRTLDAMLSRARGDAPGAGGRTDLGAALDAVIATLEPRIAESGATVERGPLGTVPLGEADTRRLLQNLVENAIRYRGDAPPRIRVSLVASPQRLELRVADNGRGIPPRRRAAVLESGVGEGTGLGLAICRRIVEDAGGVLRIRPGPGGRGTEVVAYLPRP